ncbi:MAG: aminotransferase class I/II-fold pyridoxal phosphate-dependent enzyme [Patescibacteria group bacterium]
MLKFRENIQKMTTYSPPLEGRSEKPYLLLDFNERTVEPGLKVKEALKDFVEQGRLRVYPEYGDLEEKIALYAGVENNQAIATNGADQAIDIICRSHLGEGDKVIIPSPSFPMYGQSALCQAAVILEPPYKQDGSFPIDEVLEMLNKEGRVRLVILCNPNNPLGATIKLEALEKILQLAQEKEIAVLHDEAYFEFSGLTAKNLIVKYDNLYIVRTFAKAFGLVATRIGYALSQEANLRELLKIRGPYDVNMFAKTAVLAALSDTGYVADYVSEVMGKAKPRLEKFLAGKGIFFFPSSANFLFLPMRDAKGAAEALRQQNILVRPKKGPENQEGLRISIGEEKDIAKLISAFDSLPLDIFGAK